jgi:hypothetical protein
MRKYWPLALIALVAVSGKSLAQDTSATQAGAPAPAAEAAVGTSVADRALVGAAESFPASAGKLACFARIMNATDTDVEFVWYKGDAEQGRVKQSVKGSPWRTWSTKTLPADAAGEWRCDVVQGEKVLQSVKFRIE